MTLRSLRSLRSLWSLACKGPLWVLMACLACVACDQAPGETRTSREPRWAKGPAGLPVRWASLDIRLCIGEPPAELGIAYGELAELVRDSVGAWGLERRVAVVPCAAAAKTSEDGVNTLTFGAIDSGSAGERYGRTFLYTRRLPTDAAVEEILEADVELYVAAVRATRRHGPAALANIVSHELGHVWGLAHACSYVKLQKHEPAPPSCGELLRDGANLPVMFPTLTWGASDSIVTHPTTNEREAVLSAYGAREEERDWLGWWALAVPVSALVLSAPWLSWRRRRACIQLRGS